MRALDRGLHVLAEKPIGMDAGQARETVDEAEARGLVLAEGFHYVFHPMFTRALELLGQGVIGEVEHVEAVFDGAVPRGPESAIYLDPSLGGGALLHQGSYALHAVRSFARRSRALCRARQRHDRRDGRRRIGRGRPRVPDRGNGQCPVVDEGRCAAADAGDGARVASGEATYTYQLRAFRDAVRGGPALPVQGVGAVANMTLIDAVRAAAAIG
jgi:predicted dehydrogenase